MLRKTKLTLTYFYVSHNEDANGSAYECNVPAEETKKSSCCCGENSVAPETDSSNCVDTENGLQNIKVLVAGCKFCHEMYENTKTAMENAGIYVEVEYITDMENVMAYGVMSMPGLVVNEKLVSMSKVLKPADVEKLLHKLVF